MEASYSILILRYGNYEHYQDFNILDVVGNHIVQPFYLSFGSLIEAASDTKCYTKKKNLACLQLTGTSASH